jgi:hypothetical protein
MFFDVDTANLVLYFVQQTGIVFGVGAQTVILISYLLATRDNFIDQKEEQFGRAVLRVLKLGLLLIILSGALITVIHLMLGQVLVVLTPAFLFKWAIIGVLLAVTLALGKKPYPAALYEGFIGANWYALFVIHVLAPLAAWADILVIYAIWSVGFLLAWAALVSGFRAPSLASAKKPRGHEAVVVPAPKPVETLTPAPVAPKPAPVAAKIVPPPAPKMQTLPPKPPEPPKPAPVALRAPAVPHKPEELPAPSVPAVIRAVPVKPAAAPAVPRKPVQKMEVPKKPEIPVKDPDQSPGLPAVRVMPKSPQDVENHLRATVVQFS